MKTEKGIIGLMLIDAFGGSTLQTGQPKHRPRPITKKRKKQTRKSIKK